MPDFGPAAEVLFFWEKDPKPFSPRSATLNRADAGPRSLYPGRLMSCTIIWSDRLKGRDHSKSPLPPFVKVGECAAGERKRKKDARFRGGMTEGGRSMSDDDDRGREQAACSPPRLEFA
jgi:hypothetical protein